MRKTLCVVNRYAPFCQKKKTRHGTIAMLALKRSRRRSEKANIGSWLLCREFFLKYLYWTFSSEGYHCLVVAPNQMFFGFLIELINTSKGFPVIKIPLVISVTSLYLSVMPRRPRWYQNMLYSHFLQCFLKWAFICFADVFVGKLCSVICLYCSYLKRKYFYKHFQKLYRVLGRMLFKAVYNM